MAIPEYQRLMLPLLQMAQGGNDIALQDAVQKLAEEFHLTPEEIAQRLPSGQTLGKDGAH